MFRILFLMLILLVGLIAGPYIAGHQGYVRIETDGNVIEMSIVMLVVFFVAAMAIVYAIEWILRKFFSMSKGSYNWFFKRKRKRAQKQTLEGLIKMSEGNYSKAEKLIGKNAKHSDEPVLNFIKAAEAAQQQGHTGMANEYLLEAEKIAGSDNVALELARTRILMMQDKLPKARSSIDSLVELAPRNSEVLRTAVDVYQKSGAHVALDQIIENVKSEKVLPKEEYTQVSNWVDDGLLDQKLHEEGVDGLLGWWKNQPSRRLKSVYPRVGLVQRLIESDDHDSASEITYETIKKFDDEELHPLFEAITQLDIPEDGKLYKLLNKRFGKAQESYSDDYARIIGYSNVRAGLYEKAKPFFTQLIEHKECTANDRTMALYVAEKLNDVDLTNYVKKLSLEEVNVKAEDPVPALPEKLEEAKDAEIEKV